MRLNKIGTKLQQNWNKIRRNLSARARIQKKIDNRALFIDRVPILHVCIRCVIILVLCDFRDFL